MIGLLHRTPSRRSLGLMRLLLAGVLISLCVSSTPRGVARSEAAPVAGYGVALLRNPAGGHFEARDLNDAGQVVGFYPKGDGTGAGRWENGAVAELASLTGRGAVATAITTAGVAVGYAYAEPSAGRVRFAPVQWQGATISELAVRAEYPYASPLAVSEAGGIAGFASTDDGLRHGMLWHDGQLVASGQYQGAETTLTDINSGKLAVGHTLTPHLEVAFTWRFDGRTLIQEQLPHLGQAEGMRSRALGVNDAGIIVGASTLADGNPLWRPVLWENGQVRELPLLPGADSGFAHAINSSGQIVGVNVFEERSVAVLWLNRQPYDLNGLLPPDAGVIVGEGFRINDRGQILAYGAYEGIRASLLLTPARQPAWRVLLPLVRTGALR